MIDLNTILQIADSGDADLLTEEEAAQLPTPAPRDTNFLANLAEALPETTLTTIGRLVCEGFEADEQSRRDWVENEKIGLRLLGVSQKVDGEPAFEGGSTAVFPGLIETVIQFQARAMAEVWPPEGPAKAFVEGMEQNAQRELQARRVAGYLNWLYCDRMPGGYQQHDRMMFRLGLSGSCFKKVSFDALADCVMSRFVPAEELAVPYGATDLETTPRITHVLKYAGADVERLMERGVFRTIELQEAFSEAPTPLQADLDAITGSSGEPTAVKTDLRHHATATQKARFDRAMPMTCLEQSVYLDVDNEPANSPYLVTVERDSQKVLAIYRDWRERDSRRRRRNRFVHYYLFPGLDGFYGLGFLQVLGRLARTQSGALRALLDAAHLENLKGGYRSSDVRLPQSNRKDGLRIRPGEWLPVDATTDELQRLFVTIPYGSPSQTLFNLLQWLDEVMRRIGGTTSELVGETTKDVPVGTTLARIEQGLKVQTAIQIRIHQAQAAELALMVSETADTLPDANYCRDVLQMEPAAFAAEFDERVDVRPVSNPNTITSTQRLAIAQAVVDLADKAPDLLDRTIAYRSLLEAMRLPNVDQLVLGRTAAQRMGPVEENMALMLLRPVKSFPDQDHTAHAVVHQQWLTSLDEESRRRVDAMASAHIAEHLAWRYHLQMQQAMGMPLPATPLEEASHERTSDPVTENQLALLAANAVQVMAQAQAAPAAPSSADAAALNAEAVEQTKAQAESRRKDALAAAQIARDDQAAIAKMSRESAEQEVKLIQKYLSSESKQALVQPEREVPLDY